MKLCGRKKFRRGVAGNRYDSIGTGISSQFRPHLEGTSCWVQCHWAGRPREHRLSLWNHNSNLNTAKVITTSGFVAVTGAILQVPLPVQRTKSTAAPLSYCTSKTWIYPFEFNCYCVCKPKYHYIRFSGRHLEFPTSGYITQCRQLHHRVPRPHKCGDCCWNFVPTCSRSWVMPRLLLFPLIFHRTSRFQHPYRLYG